eukprot:TRINITY_DN24201_c0_g1_i1.p1 TRINITY_DN24201_c0_g1~~TRINITY_DN24201_c0_g1_i1.p1  ORF type:complete len:271 (+),score=85.91 TRINITY_DN24201_c0_g1_i1:52-813(+)
MPASVASEAEYEEQRDEEEEPTKDKKTKDKKKKEEDEVSEDKPQVDDDDDELETRGGRNDYGGGGGGGGADGDSFVSKKFHLVMLTGLVTTLICLLAIIPSRSLGIGKTHKISAGAWEICAMANGVETCSSSAGCDWDGHRKATGAFGILCILLSIVMIVFEVLEMMSPGKFSFFAKVQCLFNHILWLFILIAWACWAGGMQSFNSCEQTKAYSNHFYYAWGFVFLVCMWLVQMILAVFMTMKAMGKKLPCGL